MKPVLKPVCQEARPTLDRHRQRGISVIEMMVAMVLGLAVIMGVMAVMQNNRQNFRVTESMSELQENARMGFELIARDIRAARDTGCGPSAVDTTPLFPTATAWWQTWNPLRGYNGSTATTAVGYGGSPGQRINGTHALQVMGTRDGWPLRSDDITATTVDTVAGHPFEANDIVVVCDYNGFSTRMYRIQGVTSNTVTLNDTTTAYNGQIAPLAATTWFIGNNGRANEGGRALYRVRFNGSNGTIVEEVLPGIIDMRLRYRLEGGSDFITDPTATQWDLVTAIEIALTAQTTQVNLANDPAAGAQVGADGRLQRTFTHVVTLRN